MISLDPLLEQFIAGNWKTLSLLFAILIGLAEVSPWTWDEKVLNVIIAPFRKLFGQLGSPKKNSFPQ